MASLVIDDPLQIGECFFEKNLRFTKTELQEVIYQLADGKLRRRLEDALAAFRRAAELAPNNAQVQYALGLTLKDKGDAARPERQRK